MKRLCVFYRLAQDWLGRPVEWIVCKECQRKLQRGENLAPGYHCIGQVQRRATDRKK